MMFPGCVYSITQNHAGGKRFVGDEIARWVRSVRKNQPLGGFGGYQYKGDDGDIVLRCVIPMFCRGGNLPPGDLKIFRTMERFYSCPECYSGSPNASTKDLLISVGMRRSAKPGCPYTYKLPHPLS